MSVCVIFGGSGFIGTHLAEYFLKVGRFSQVYIADIKKSPLAGKHGIISSITDVRHPIVLNALVENPEWIFNFAAVHREPGHEPEEYFETNLRGAENICSFAEATNCANVFFTSSIAVYGPCLVPTDESKLPNPVSPYGASKFPAELIHRIWLAKSKGRRLIIARPGVVYGPGDPGNILRMIRAIKKGYFVFPGSQKIHKSYAYIFGLIDSIVFTMNQKSEWIVYNYVETPTETIGEIATTVKRKLNSKAPIISILPSLLVPVAFLLQKLRRKNNPIHPVRVKKAGTPTHIVPKVLMDLGFTFKYDFKKSVDHWLQASPDDFK